MHLYSEAVIAPIVNDWENDDFVPAGKAKKNKKKPTNRRSGAPPPPEADAADGGDAGDGRREAVIAPVVNDWENDDFVPAVGTRCKLDPSLKAPG